MFDSNRVLVNLGFVLFLVILLVLCLHRHVYHLHHVLLQRFFFQVESVFVPDEVRHLGVEPVLPHASFEETNHVSVVRVFNELEFPAVVHVLFELFGVALAEFFNSDLELLFLDVVVLLVLAPARKTLPGETAPQEVKEHVANGFQVISARLLVANVRVDACVPCSSCEVLPLTEWNVLSI